MAKGITDAIEGARGSWLARDPGWSLSYLLIIVIAATGARLIALLPIESLLRDFSVDDTFYYAQTAKNLAQHGIVSFDGVNLTNGFHPLWLFLLVPVYWLPLDSIEAVHLARQLDVALVAVALLCLTRVAQLGSACWFLVVPVLLRALQYRALYVGLEASCNLLTVSLALLCAMRFWERPDTRRQVLLGAALCASVLARLENILFSLLLVAALLSMTFIHDRPRQRRGVWIALCGFAGFVLLHFTLNEWIFGSPVPVSGLVKKWWASEGVASPGLLGALANLKTLSEIWVVATGLKAGLLLLVTVTARRLLAWRFGRGKLASRAELFEVLVVTVAAFHAAKCVVYAITSVPYWTSYQWYHVSGPLTSWLSFVLVGSYIVRFCGWALDNWGSALRGIARVPALVPALVATVFVVSYSATQVRSAFTRYGEMSRSRVVDWEICSYRMAQWINANVPRDARIGSFDSGVLGYFTDQPVVPLDGLINSVDYFEALKSQRFEEFIHVNGVEYIANLVPDENDDFAEYVRAKTRQQMPLEGQLVPLYTDPDNSIVHQEKTRRYRIYQYAPDGGKDVIARR